MLARAPQTSQQFIASIQNAGLIIVKQDKLYFIPLELLNKCEFPAAFQNGTLGISEDYFFKDPQPNPNNPPPPPNSTNQPDPDSIVFKGLNKALAQFRVADGVSQAIWLDEVGNNRDGKPVSKAPASNEVLFLYTNDKKKIIVDMVKGGRPSNR